MTMALSTPLTTVLVLLAITLSTQSVRGDSSTIDLDVSTSGDQSDSQLVINCSVESNLSSLATLASLAVFGSKPYGPRGQFDLLAVVDMWSPKPTLASELEDSNVLLNGEIGPERNPFLVLSWNYGANLHHSTYKCVANGIDERGKAKSISTIVKLEVASERCCENSENITTQIRNLSTLYGAFASTSRETLEEVHLLKTKFDQLENKLDTMNLRTRVQSTLLAIDLAQFDVSGLYKDRMYLASKKETTFNLHRDNSACQAAGGYLLEIDDNEENQFTFDFAKRIGGSDHFALGGNDIEKEGKFVYFNSKKPVPDHVTWMRDRPNNAGGKEHCMEIWISQGGLNDIPCETKTKFVCEIPLRF